MEFVPAAWWVSKCGKNSKIMDFVKSDQSVDISSLLMQVATLFTFPQFP